MNTAKALKSIFKTFTLSVLMIAQVHFAYAQTSASILPPAKTTFVDQNGKPLTSGKVYSYIPGTLTPKSTWQDAAETILNTNPVTLDVAGRALILGSGSYRQQVYDRNNNLQWDQVTASTGSGGSTGPTATGDGDLVGTVKPWAGMTAPNQYLFTYGQEVSRTTYLSLFTAITSAQAVFCNTGSAVLTGIGDTTNFWIGMTVEVACLGAGFSTIISKTATTVTMAANANVTLNTTATFFPWGRGNGVTTFNLPDFRGYVLAGNDIMGGTAAGVLTTANFGSPTPDASGAAGGAQTGSTTLITANLPPYTPTVSSYALTVPVQGWAGTAGAQVNDHVSLGSNNGGGITLPVGGSITMNAQGGTSTPFNTNRIQPTKTTNYIIKVTPDTNSATASGVTSLGLMTGDIACGVGLTCTGNIINTSNSTIAGKAVYYANGYGTLCDGVTNDTAHIQATIDAAQSTGGIVQLPAGQCRVDSTLNITTPIIVQGVGMGAQGGGVSNTSVTQLLANFANGDVILATTDFGVVFRDFQVNSNVGPRSSGAAIHIKAATPLVTTNSNSIINNVAFSNQVVDIQCTVCAQPRIFNTYHQAFVSHGILIDYVASAVESGGGYIYNNYMFGNGTDVCITSHAGYFDIHHNLLNNCQFGVSLIIDQRAAGSPFINSNKIENCVTTCIIIQNSGGITAAMLQITDNEFSTSNATSTSSIQILPNSGGAGPWIDGIQIARNIARNSLTAGGGAWTYNIQTGTNVQIVGNQSDHLGGDTSNMFLFGAAADLVAPVIVSNNTDQGATTGVKYVLPTAQITFMDPQGLAFASMPALAANGSQIFVTNGASNSNPLTGASTGAMAIRQNATWLGLGAITYGAGVAALLTGPASGTGGPAGTNSPTFTGAPILAAPSATTAIVGSSATLPAGDVAVITGNATTLPISGAGVLLHLGTPNSGQTAILADSFAAASTNVFRRANNTAGSPSALALNDNIMNLTSLGYGTTAYATTARAYIRTFAAEAWTDAAQGTYATIATTPSTTLAAVEAVRFQASGGVSIGTSTDKGIGTLNLNSSLYVAGAHIATGTVPTGTTGSCVASSFVGGATAGKFSAAVCAGGTIILSALPTAPNGYTCNAQDQTTPADTLKQTANTTTSVTFTSTTVAADVIVFSCIAW